MWQFLRSSQTRSRLRESLFRYVWTPLVGPYSAILRSFYGCGNGSCFLCE